jgi:hypothetical protein
MSARQRPAGVGPALAAVGLLLLLRLAVGDAPVGVGDDGGHRGLDPEDHGEGEHPGDQEVAVAAAAGHGHAAAEQVHEHQQEQHREQRTDEHGGRLPPPVRDVATGDRAGVGDRPAQPRAERYARDVESGHAGTSVRSAPVMRR